MNYQKFHQKFLETLVFKFPGRSGITKAIAPYLGLDQKSLARRLRGETPFTLQEIVTICTSLNISIDALILDREDTVHPMKIYLNDLSDQKMPESFRNLLLGMEYAAGDRETGKVFLCSNLISNGFYSGYPTLSRFAYYIWSYRRYPGKYGAMDDFVIPGEIANAVAAYGSHARAVGNSTYLFSMEFMHNVAGYVRFFHETGLLPTKYALLICQELDQLVDELEKASVYGVWPGTDNRIDIHVTPLSVPGSVLLTESRYYKAAIIYAFFLNPIATLHPETFNEISDLAHSLLRQSENISGSGEKTRIGFINKQRETIRRLTESLDENEA